MSAGKTVDFRYLNSLSTANKENDKASKRRAFRYFGALAFCSFCILIVWMSFSDYELLNFKWSNVAVSVSCDHEFHSPECEYDMTRSKQYCARETVGGYEGKFYGHDKFNLRQVIILIRHGDRSSIHKMPNSKVLSKNSTKYFHPDAIHYVPLLNSFEIKSLGDTSISNSLDSTKIFSVSDRSSPPGILSTTGFMQHINQGRYLHKAYSSFLSTVDPFSTSLYVRSTYYDRTIQSAAALLLTMFPTLGTPATAGKLIPIHVHPEHSSEHMHGVGSILTSKKDGGDAVLQGSCKAASAFTEMQAKNFATSDIVMMSLEKRFGSGIRHMLPTEMADSLLPYKCHGLSMPCAVDASDGSCAPVTDTLLEALMREGDKWYCDRYAGARGGLNGTLLSMHPFLSEILSLLRASAEADTLHVPKALALFSGHDTVVGSTLAALGVFQKHCRWPKYASRVAIELWTPLVPVSKDPRVRPAGAAVRVLYNGLDVTRDIPACAVAMPSSLRGGPSAAFPPLCPLEAFGRQVIGSLGSHKSFEAACAAAVPS